jgi:urea transporter/murein DD-endopeptidase MepM/ murein hydrolase activator NlpD
LEKLKLTILTILKGVVYSYPQVFFSKSKLLAILLILLTFLDPYTGIGGLVCIISANSAAYFIGLNTNKISSGLFGFNALLVGLGIGSYYSPSWELYTVIAFSGLLALLITIALEGIIGKYYLPFLSIPFLLTLWIIQLASHEFNALGISERGVYFMNELYSIGGKDLVDLYTQWNLVIIPVSIKTYLLSLGAIFFQENFIAGILISIGLLIYSRIAFSLSLIGFYAAYFFFILIGSDITQANYTYIGFNFILTSIAIGGFFMVPSRNSYLWAILVIPITALITIGSSKFFDTWHLSVYSLPFNLIVLMFIYSMRFRTQFFKYLSEVSIQQFMPERNLYSFLISVNRFSKNFSTFPIKLPFWGEWNVEQGHSGDITHKDDWKHAWDFTIRSTDNKTYISNGAALEDYLCYNKAVIAPAYGTVEEAIDGIPDNAVGNVNLQHNWGNTIVIKHADFLYSELSHLKAGSIKVFKGDFVKPGQIIAAVGNSGRSPEPHLHMQLQSTPYTGSKTLFYPINHFVSRSKNELTFNSFDIPKQNTLISNIEVNQLIKKSFTFIPGQKLNISYEENGNQLNVSWEVITDIYNNTYIYCHNSKSAAYIFSDGILHFFKHFEGDRKSLLYYFYLGCYKISLGYYKNLKLDDNYSLSEVFSLPKLIIQDFFAPFFRFMSASYNIEYISMDDNMNPTKIILKSNTIAKVLNKKVINIDFDIEIGQNGIAVFEVKSKNKKIRAILVEA